MDQIAIAERSRALLPAVAVLFVGSGCAALIYEIVWLQMLQLVIGSTAVSLGVLLGTFMGGMCVGSLLLPRVISRKHHPLKVYAWLELAIAAIAIVLLYGMPLIERLYTQSVGHGASSVLLRAVISAICLLPPTLLMGATLPAIARWVKSTPDGVAWLGLFYGGNIIGAVFGCLLAGFYLLRVHDMAVATYVAVAVDLLVCLAGFALATVTRHEGATETQGGKVTSQREPLELAKVGSAGASPSRRRRSQWHEAAAVSTLEETESLAAPAGSASADGAWAVYVAIGLSGLTGLGAEVVWTRLLSLTLGATVYTFSIILGVFLTGLGIGSSVGALLSRTLARPRLAFGICQLLLGVMIAWAGYCICASLPYWPIDVALNAQMDSAPWLTFQLDMARCLWAILPAAVLWGASFPLALAAVASRERDSGELVGNVYAANTVGAIVGALFFSMVLIPMLGLDGMGTRDSQRVLIVIAAASSAVLLAPMVLGRAATARRDSIGGQCPPYRSVARISLAVVVVFAIGGASLWLASRMRQVPAVAVAYGRNSGTWVADLADGVFDKNDLHMLGGDERDHCIYIGEGMNVSVAVTVSRQGYQYFHGAGKVQASSDPRDMRLQRMLGHLSALCFKNHSPENVLVVACGAGVTAGSFIPYDSVKRIVICDIEPLVPQRVTPMFGPQNYHIVDGIDKENPHIVDGKQVEVIYDDGRHFVRTTREMFDVITSDPIDPWVKGCAALNTVEYYQMCKEHLRPGGVMALWIPFYESNQDTARSVLGTFFKVFPNGIVWSNDNGQGGYDAVLFGQVEPTRIDLDETRRWLDDHPKVQRSLLDVGFGSDGRGVAVELFASYAGQATQLREWMRDAQINTDRNLRLQYLAGMSVNSYDNDLILRGILDHYQFPSDIFSGSDAQLRQLRNALQQAGRTENRFDKLTAGTPPQPTAAPPSERRPRRASRD